MSDDAGSPAWVVTPGGAWCRSLYLCGALTEVAEIADVLHCRLADPTGAFDIVAGGRMGACRGTDSCNPGAVFCRGHGNCSAVCKERGLGGLGQA